MSDGSDGARQARLKAAAERARAEAESRRRQAEETAAAHPSKELHGRDGPEPVRFGDWETNGRAVDF